MELDEKGNVVVRHAITGEILHEGFVMRTGRDGKTFYFFSSQKEQDAFVGDNPKI